MAWGPGKTPCTRARPRAIGPQDTLAVIQPSLDPGLGPDSPRVSTPQLVVPLGPDVSAPTAADRSARPADARRLCQRAPAPGPPGVWSESCPEAGLRFVQSFAAPAPCIFSLDHPLSGPSQLWSQNPTHWGLSGHS